MTEEQKCDHEIQWVIPCDAGETISNDLTIKIVGRCLICGKMFESKGVYHQYEFPLYSR